MPYNLQPMPGTLEKPLWPIISNPQSTSETLPTHMPSEASDDESESINSKDQGSVGSIQIYIRESSIVDNFGDNYEGSRWIL